MWTRLKIKTPKQLIDNCLGAYSAEEEGFEPPVVLPTTVFKTAALNRSAIPPGTKVEEFFIQR